MENSEKILLHSVKFIRKNGLQSLLDRFSLKAKYHSKYKNILQLSYSQFKSPFETPEVQECRNLVLDADRNYKPLAWGFKKFFNYSEPNAIKMNENEPVKVYEKIDGSIMMLYFYQPNEETEGEWCLSSSSLPDASGVVMKNFVNGEKVVEEEEGEGEEEDQTTTTFNDLFWEVWKDMKYALPSIEDRDKCFMFELFTQHNIIVVRNHEKRGNCILLLGVRNMTNLHELDPEPIGKKYKMSPSFDTLTTLGSVVEKAKLLDPMECEGFVIRQSTRDTTGSFPRLKVKSPAYVAVHYLRSSGSSKKVTERKEELWKAMLLKVLLSNESDEFLVYFPKLRWQYEKSKVILRNFFTYLSGKTEELKKKVQEKKDDDEEEEIFKSWRKGVVYDIKKGDTNEINALHSASQSCLTYREFYIPVVQKKVQDLEYSLSCHNVKRENLGLFHRLLNEYQIHILKYCPPTPKPSYDEDGKEEIYEPEEKFEREMYKYILKARHEKELDEIMWMYGDDEKEEDFVGKYVFGKNTNIQVDYRFTRTKKKEEEVEEVVRWEGIFLKTVLLYMKRRNVMVWKKRIIGEERKLDKLGIYILISAFFKNDEGKEYKYLWDLIREFFNYFGNLFDFESKVVRVGMTSEGETDTAMNIISPFDEDGENITKDMGSGDLRALKGQMKRGFGLFKPGKVSFDNLFSEVGKKKKKKK